MSLCLLLSLLHSSICPDPILAIFQMFWLLPLTLLTQLWSDSKQRRGEITKDDLTAEILISLQTTNIQESKQTNPLD